jgi:uncharacterized membrane protein YadS
VGTTIKLARALWIVPVSILTALVTRSRTRIRWPWFIGLFCLAAFANTCFPQFSWVFGEFNHLGRAGLTATLFLIGTGITRCTLREVGPRPLAQGLLLWIAVATVSLLLIRANLVRI